MPLLVKSIFLIRFHEKDIVTLRTTGYQPFSPDFKPWVFKDKTVNSLYVVVPGNDAAIFQISVMPDPNGALEMRLCN